jgi:hypothetical protein
MQAEDAHEGGGEGIEPEPRDDGPADRRPQRYTPQPEVPGPGPLGRPGEEQRGADEADVLPDRAEDGHGAGRVAQAGAEGRRHDADDRGAEERRHQPGDQGEHGAPRAPARTAFAGGHDARRQLRMLADRVGMRVGEGLRPEGVHAGLMLERPRGRSAGQQLGQRPDRAHAGRRRPAVAAHQDGRDPRGARAGDVGLLVVADVQRGGRRHVARRLQGGREDGGLGLAAPSSADVTTASTSGRRPVLARTSCSETSQLLTTTSRAPPARSARRTAGTSG